MGHSSSVALPTSHQIDDRRPRLVSRGSSTDGNLIDSSGSDREGLARDVALQPHYSLVERHHCEGELAELCALPRTWRACSIGRSPAAS